MKEESILERRRKPRQSIKRKPKKDNQPEDAGVTINDDNTFVAIQQRLWDTLFHCQPTRIRHLLPSTEHTAHEIPSLIRLLKKRQSWRQTILNLGVHANIIKHTTEVHDLPMLLFEVILDHHATIIRKRWSYHPLLNKLAKGMDNLFSFILADLMNTIKHAFMKNTTLKDTYAASPMEALNSADFKQTILTNNEKDMLRVILVGKLWYARQQGCKWMRAYFRQTTCEMDELLDMTFQGQAVYALFHAHQRRSYVHYKEAKDGDFGEIFLHHMKRAVLEQALQRQRDVSPHAYFATLGMHRWILCPLDQLEDSDNVVRICKQWVYKNRRRIIDTSLLEPPPKKVIETKNLSLNLSLIAETTTAPLSLRSKNTTPTSRPRSLKTPTFQFSSPRLLKKTLVQQQQKKKLAFMR